VLSQPRARARAACGWLACASGAGGSVSRWGGRARTEGGLRPEGAVRPAGAARARPWWRARAAPPRKHCAGGSKTRGQAGWRVCRGTRLTAECKVQCRRLPQSIWSRAAGAGCPGWGAALHLPRSWGRRGRAPARGRVGAQRGSLINRGAGGGVNGGACGRINRGAGGGVNGGACGRAKGGASPEQGWGRRGSNARTPAQRLGWAKGRSTVVVAAAAARRCVPVCAARRGNLAAPRGSRTTRGCGCVRNAGVRPCKRLKGGKCCRKEVQAAARRGRESTSRQEPLVGFHARSCASASAMRPAQAIAADRGASAGGPERGVCFGRTRLRLRERAQEVGLLARGSPCQRQCVVRAASEAARRGQHVRWAAARQGQWPGGARRQRTRCSGRSGSGPWAPSRCSHSGHARVAWPPQVQNERGRVGQLCGLFM
jgi:hypothetical protein